MKILVSNDDGYLATGINVLAEALACTSAVPSGCAILIVYDCPSRQADAGAGVGSGSSTVPA